MATIKASISTKADKNGYSQIFLRISVSKFQSARIKSGLFINQSRWDDKRGCISAHRIPAPLIKETHDIKEALSLLYAKIDRVCALYVMEEEALTSSFFSEVLPLIGTLGNGEDKKIEPITKEQIEQRLDERRNPQKYETLNFFKAMEKFRDDVKKKRADREGHIVREGDKSYEWKKDYNVLVRSLKRYELYQQREDGNFHLSFDTISSDTLYDIEDYLRNEPILMKDEPEQFKIIDELVSMQRKRKGSKENKEEEPEKQPRERSRNTICAMMRKLRAFLNWAMEDGILKSNPLRGFNGTSSEKYGTPLYISIEERNHIADFDLSSNPSLEVQRDIFIFQCLIGCRVSDLLSLRPDNVSNGEVSYIAHKTQDVSIKTISVPLSERAAELIKKYRGKDSKGRLFPFISSQKYNEDIKRIFLECGITRMVTVFDSTTGTTVQKPINEIASSHMARRTFIGNLYKKVKDPNLIGSMSGHAEGSKAFARYRMIDKDIKTDAIKLIE